MKLFRRQVKRLAHALALIRCAGLLILAVLIALDIMLRAVIDHPLKGVTDMAAIVMAVVAAACIPKSLPPKQNISIEALGRALGRRAMAALESFAALAVLGFFVLMTWQFVHCSASITASGRTKWALKLPVGPWWRVATGFFGVSAVAQLAVPPTDLSSLFGTSPEADAD